MPRFPASRNEAQYLEFSPQKHNYSQSSLSIPFPSGERDFDLAPPRPFWERGLGGEVRIA